MATAKDAVLTNSDISRIIVSQAARPVKLLQASKQIRHSEPCADLFHIWSHGGCPQHPSPAELECLNGIGGLGSAFCQGVYEVQADGQHRTGVSATSVALRVARLIERPPGDVVIIVGLGPTVLKLQLVVRSRPRIFLTEDGWRARPCLSVCLSVKALKRPFRFDCSHRFWRRFWRRAAYIPERPPSLRRRVGQRSNGGAGSRESA